MSTPEIQDLIHDALAFEAAANACKCLFFKHLGCQAKSFFLFLKFPLAFYR